MSQADGRSDRRLTQHNNALYGIDRAVKKTAKRVMQVSLEVRYFLDQIRLQSVKNCYKYGCK